MTQERSEQPGRPIPLPDEASQPLFDGALRGELMINRCRPCGTYLAAGTQICPECLSDDIEWTKASGNGTLFTFGLMHQLYHPGFANETPYNVAVVELEEGPRINTNMVGIANEDLEVGMAVKVTFEDVGEGVKVPKFRPAG